MPMKVHRIFRSLAMKLYILILLLVIPINLLVLFLSQMILRITRTNCGRATATSWTSSTPR